MSGQSGDPLDDLGLLAELDGRRPQPLAPGTVDEPTIDEFYEHASCGYVSLTADGLIVRTNETFVRWTGRTREQLLTDLRFSELLTVGSRLYYETHCAPMLAAGMELREIALDVRRADGSVLLVLVGATVHGPAVEGAPPIVRLTVFDASGRRGFERHLLAERDAERLGRQHAEALGRIADRLAVLDTPAQIGAALIGELVGGSFATQAEVVPRSAEPARTTASFTTAADGGTTVGLVPIPGSGGETLGTLRVESATPPDREARALLTSAAELTGRALGRVQRNAAVARANRSGGLGGLPNERWWTAALKAEMRRASQVGSALTVVVVEITRLERVTMQQGMAAADALLLGVSDAWRETGFDLLSRFGGEEFVVLMPGLDVDRAKAAVARAKRIAGTSRHFSVGVAQWDRAETAAGLVSRAEVDLAEGREHRTA